VNIALAQTWREHHREGADATIFTPEDPEGNFLDATINQGILEKIAQGSASVWLPSTSTFTKQFRPDEADIKLLAREAVDRRKTEDAVIGPFIQGLRQALDLGRPTAFVGVQEVERPGIADTATLASIIKGYTDVSVLRIGRLTLVTSKLEKPGNRLLNVIEKDFRGWQNKLLEWLISAARKAAIRVSKEKRIAPSYKRGGVWGHTLARAAKRQLFGRRAGVLFENKDNTKLEEDPDDERQYVGGLRRTCKAVAKLPTLIIAGHKLSQAMDGLLDEEEDIVPFVIELIESGSKVKHDRETDRHRCSNACKKCKLELQVGKTRQVMAEVTGAVDTEPVTNNGGVSTALRPGLFGAWQRFAQDPDDQVEGWLRHGGPCGLELTPQNSGVFAPTEDAGEVGDPSEILGSDAIIVETKIDRDEDAFIQLATYEDEGYVRSFASVKEAQEFENGPLVFSDLVVVEKIKPDGTKKRRLILDCKSSGVSHASKKTERGKLPRVLDVVFDTLEICCEENVDPECEEAEFFVVGVEEAYWNVPISPKSGSTFVPNYVEGFGCVFVQRKGPEEVPYSGRGRRHLRRGWARQ